MRRLIATCIGLALMGIVPAAAHPVLVGSDPPQGAHLVEPPTAVIVEFSEPVTAVEVAVVSPGGDDVSRGLVPEDADRSIRQEVRPLPEQGTYTVRYRVVSEDDHTVTGELEFDYAGPVEDGDDGDAEPPQDQGGPAAQNDANPSASADERPLVLRLWPLLLLTLVAAAGIAVAARALRSIRSQPSDS